MQLHYNTATALEDCLLLLLVKKPKQIKTSKYFYFSLSTSVTDKPTQKRQSTHQKEKQCLCRLLISLLFTWSYLATFHDPITCQIYYFKISWYNTEGRKPQSRETITDEWRQTEKLTANLQPSLKATAGSFCSKSCQPVLSETAGK